jgi:hypothetical protein
MLSSGQVANFLQEEVMEEIRYIESDDNYVTLESKNGDRFKLAIDDSLRAAVRIKATAKFDEGSISPREIQERIRTGATISELATTTGQSEELITKFAAPVLDEIDHIVRSALSVRLVVATDRPNVTEHVEFGAVIDSRLRLSGAVDVSWSARKIEGATWQLSATFSLGDQPQQAIWLYEPRKLSLAPENDMAIRLSTEEKIQPSTVPSLTVVEPVTFAVNRGSIAVEENRPDETETVDEHSLAHQAEVDQAMTVDLLDSLRKKRENRKDRIGLVETPSDADNASGTNETADESSSSLEDEPAPTTDTSVTERISGEQAAKKGRASMPSWDQIVFGTKADE